jgi:CRP/FNR family transcriptional regulator
MSISEMLSTKFQALYEDDLKQEIAEHGKVVEVKADDLILDMGSYIKTIPLVVNGAIKVLREDDQGHEILLYYVMDGNTCAMSLTCCLSFTKSKIRAIAEEDSTLITLPVQLVEDWMQKYSSWKNFIMLTYSSRFDELLKTIDLLAFEHMDKRLLHFLNEKIVLQGSPKIKITHQDIALALNSSREAISRLLKKMENTGMVKLSRNQIELLTPQKIQLI